MCTAIEVELVNSRRRYSLVLLTKIKEQTIWTGRENVNNGVKIVCLYLTQHVGDRFSKYRGVFSARNGLLARACGHRE